MTPPITPEALIEALKRLVPGDLLAKNDVGNLAILREDEYVGYVDLADATIVYMPTRWREQK
jgi:hypothetical protein